MNILIPMAGLGSRFANNGVTEPKPLIRVNQKTLIEHSIKSFDVDGKFIFVTRKYENPQHSVELNKLLKTLRPECAIIEIDRVTNGASQTALCARELINSSTPLVIYNCDQIINWNPTEFLKFVADPIVDGAVVLYKDQNPKNSFAEIKNSRVVQVVEKNPISNDALIGFHYWKRGCDFVESAEKLLTEFTFHGRPECYISETYNYLIQQGHNIFPYFVAPNIFTPLGTPEDVARYLGKVKEFYSSKPMTVFCDIDGTLLKHSHTISDALSQEPTLLAGVRDKMNQWDSQGHTIVLCTARKPSTRAATEAQLQSLGIAYDQLLMGVTSGGRVLINDKLGEADPNRAMAVNVITDQGFTNINWEQLGL
jgi:dTDP-glucose pyrophosphorylase